MSDEWRIYQWKRQILHGQRDPDLGTTLKVRDLRWEGTIEATYQAEEKKKTKCNNKLE